VIVVTGPGAVPDRDLKRSVWAHVVVAVRKSAVNGRMRSQKKG
jgi:hypothetical protein